MIISVAIAKQTPNLCSKNTRVPIRANLIRWDADFFSLHLLPLSITSDQSWPKFCLCLFAHRHSSAQAIEVIGIVHTCHVSYTSEVMVPWCRGTGRGRLAEMTLSLHRLLIQSASRKQKMDAAGLILTVETCEHPMYVTQRLVSGLEVDRASFLLREVGAEVQALPFGWRYASKVTGRCFSQSITR